mgnify:FL=1
MTNTTNNRRTTRNPISIPIQVGLLLPCIIIHMFSVYVLWNVGIWSILTYMDIPWPQLDVLHVAIVSSVILLVKKILGIRGHRTNSMDRDKYYTRVLVWGCNMFLIDLLVLTLCEIM